MTGDISANYQELLPEEIEQVATECARAWQDPEIPGRQYEGVVKAELAKLRCGLSVAPYAALMECLRRLRAPFLASRPSLLDVGAAGGYYSEALRLAQIYVEYAGLDVSPAFADLARQLYVGIEFQVGNACALPFADNAFDIVLSSACIMHIREYEQAIAEVARVTRRYAVFGRTPIFRNRPTAFFRKEAYGIPCLEIHFNENDLIGMCQRHGLFLNYVATVYWNNEEQFGHRTYLLEKLLPEPYASNPNV